MSNFYEKNMLIFRNRFPKYADLVDQTVIPENWSLEKVGDFFDVRMGDKLKYQGKTGELVSQSLSQADLKYPKLVIIYGVGLGYHVHRFYEEKGREAEYVLLIEQDPRYLKLSFQALDWSSLLSNEKIQIILGVGLDKMESKLTSYFDMDPKRLMLIRALTPLIDMGILPEEREYYKQCSSILKTAAENNHRYLVDLPEDSYRGFMNVIRNLETYHQMPSFDLLDGFFKGMPGIAVSTGPSLKYSFDWLKSLEDRAVMICTESSLKVLLAQGIKPHFVVCLERVVNQALFFEGLPSLPDTWFVSAPSVWPGVSKKYSGPQLIQSRGVLQMPWFFPEHKEYAIGSSVSHMAFQTLVALGCSPVMLVGQDLAFNPFSTSTHVDGIPQTVKDHYQKERKLCEEMATKENNDVLIPGNNGGMVLTNPWFKDFKRIFEVLIPKSKTLCYNVIPQEYGAKIESATRIDPSQVESLLGESKPIRQMIQDKIDATPRKTSEEIQSFIIDRIQKASYYLELYKEVAMNGMQAMSSYEQMNEAYTHEYNDYLPFFKKIQDLADRLFFHPEHVVFFDKFFTSQVLHKIIPLIELSHDIMKGKHDPKLSLYGQIELIHQWFQVIYLWASRMKKFMEEEGLRPLLKKQQEKKIAEPVETLSSVAL